MPNTLAPLESLSDIEQEAALLLAARNLIRGMVNRSALSSGGDPSSLTVVPATMESRDLFSVLLVDFVSQLGAPYPKGTDMLDGLLAVCANPHFDVAGSVRTLAQAAGAMRSWLDHEAVFPELWLPSIDRQLTLRMPRREFIYMTGNIAKHNTFRLNAVAGKLLRVLQASDSTVTHADAYRAVEDMQQWFQQDILPYHLTKICQLLNDITWGIQDYLLPEYARSYTVDEDRSALMHAEMYSYDYPLGVDSGLGKVFYWDLMNEVRSGPIFPRFQVSKYLTGKY